MLRIHEEDVLYTEADFNRFNPDGYRIVKESIEQARRANVLAVTGEERTAAMRSLRAAADLKTREQNRARERFDAERAATYRMVRVVLDRFSKLPPPVKSRFSAKLDHMVTLFNMKDFAGAKGAAENIEANLRRPPFPDKRRRTIGISGASPTALYYRGEAMERQGKFHEARELFEMCLEKNPRHIQAQAKLARLS